MRIHTSLGLAALAIGVAALAAALPMEPSAVNVGADDIGGVVTGPRGPEAGVWVIAETNDLPTKFVRIVVTDETVEIRYVIPVGPEGERDPFCLLRTDYQARVPGPCTGPRF